ncbi:MULTISPECIES: efflux RND transporter periplasmic adaptor subunit [Methylomonas]|uniref:Efflux transporter periplasmic adaptor subunit n=2 Tax=Methylomonas TaxID=416 RepID=A0A126T446_9GAMM|nr:MULTISPECIES: efflux RND transporter periplasmic adaptor subunit [Methylomonas]AMK76830.1 efflux transporter periplasmic adaptor subunit [Methylomonas denitrificans]OAI03405.1 efflux transporter periplasmic adaptor subunit [Methylomonas methanica]TCV76948.1 cobalt-zinc-cadmium efflux system membrane fusion protein [Methylomonas methanica]
MRTLIFSLLFVQALSAFAQDTQIHISQEQINNLDIKVAQLNVSRQIPLFYAPGKVVVPADREVLVSSSQPGLVTQLPVNIGDKVHKGQLLAQLHSPELVGLQQAFLTAGSELNLSSLERSRDQKLLQEGVIAERRWQETQMLHSSKSAKADEARQLLLLAGMSAAEIKSLGQNHKLDNRLNIHSPIDGVVLERLTSLGARLDVQAPLYRIADLSELWLEINIPQERLSGIRLGDSVRLEGSEITARISLLGQSVNRDNQTVLGRAMIDGAADGLRVGQNVNVQIMQNSIQTGFIVPNTAIAQNEGHAYVFVRNQDGFAVTEVTVTGKQDANSLISGPLSGSERIAIKGAVALKANWLGLGGGE